MTTLRRANSRALPRERRCYFEVGERKLSDQCLATHVLLQHRGWVGLDYHEALFAYAAAVTSTPQEKSNAIKVSPCGNVSCQMSSTFQWAFPPAHSPSMGALERPAEHRELCGLRAGGPAFIHFNGPPKARLLQAHEALQRQVWARRTGIVG